mmetsp:Transcript_38534/g.92551  ORF Transcript_38534/g.92551 Transcript_38534/m.92551 type:complete len:232 (-) Transcript_38534:2220-2915(-)
MVSARPLCVSENGRRRFVSHSTPAMTSGDGPLLLFEGRSPPPPAEQELEAPSACRSAAFCGAPTVPCFPVHVGSLMLRPACSATDLCTAATALIARALAPSRTFLLSTNILSTLSPLKLALMPLLSKSVCSSAEPPPPGASLLVAGGSPPRSTTACTMSAELSWSSASSLGAEPLKRSLYFSLSAESFDSSTLGGGGGSAKASIRRPLPKAWPQLPAEKTCCDNCCLAIWR